mmetsp:Transcript_1311/g.1672  ORF Transcript_1311/g.1672 Transcript_1311/m.1672 type:complete len:98 (+) Transcript_1311:259-552(+)
MEENKKMKTAKDDAEREMADVKKRNTLLFEENSQLNDTIHDLQQKMADELGILNATGEEGGGEPSPKVLPPSPRYGESKPEPKHEKKKSSKKKHEGL